MPEIPVHMSLERLRELTVAGHSQFAGARFTILADGWDSVALDVDNRYIIKFPRHEVAEQSLRREVLLLSVIAPRVLMPVPRMDLHDIPVTHTIHAKLPGRALDPATYAKVPESMRAEIGERLGQFYAHLHAIDADLLANAGAGPVQEWLDAETIRRRIEPHLPPALAPWANKALEKLASLGPDPHGITYGLFDGHGWNMAYDPVQNRFGGVFDFGDSGFGPLHQEFIYSNLTSPDLTERIVASYEQHTGRELDRARITLLTDIHRLWEIAEEHENAEGMAAMIQAAEAWFAMRP